jgi:putative peptidoglycan lipid II flippase
VGGALRRMAFLNAPTAVGYLVFGFLLVGALYRTGSFGVADTWLVYAVLGGYSLGLLAGTSSRLLQNAFYALRDTRTPSRIAVERVLLSAALALPLMLALDRLPVAALAGAGAGGSLFLGAAGLALASGLAAWFELGRLARVLRRRLDGWRFPWGAVARPLGFAAIAALPAALLWRLLPPLPPLAAATAVLGAYALVYLGLARWRRTAELDEWLAALRGR